MHMSLLQQSQRTNSSSHRRAKKGVNYVQANTIKALSRSTGLTGVAVSKSPAGSLKGTTQTIKGTISQVLDLVLLPVIF